MKRLQFAGSGLGILIALALLVGFGAWRYDGFIGAYNVLTVLRYNSMFALVGLGMCFVIMTGGIDLSVGSVAAMSSVVSAYLSPYGLIAGLVGGLISGAVAGSLNGFIITKLKIFPFIATLAVMLAASGTGLLLANNQSVSVSYDTAFTALGQGNLLSPFKPDWVDGDNAGWLGGALSFLFGFPTPAWIALVAYIVGSIALNAMAFGRYVLAVGGGEEASRLMGFPCPESAFNSGGARDVIALLGGTRALGE